MWVHSVIEVFGTTTFLTCAPDQDDDWCRRVAGLDAPDSDIAYIVLFLGVSGSVHVFEAAAGNGSLMSTGRLNPSTVHFGQRLYTQRLYLSEVTNVSFSVDSAVLVLHWTAVAYVTTALELSSGGPMLHAPPRSPMHPL